MAEQKFDLTDSARRQYADTRGVRIAFAVISGVLAATGVGGLVYQLAHGTLVSSFRVLYGLPYYVAFAVAAFFAWGSTKFASGANGVAINDEGVTFIFSGLNGEQFRWVDPRFRLVLVDYRHSALARKYNVDGYARIRHHPPSHLTGEVLDALTQGARERRLAVSVRERGGRWSFAGPRHVWIEIRAPDSRLRDLA